MNIEKTIGNINNHKKLILPIIIILNIIIASLFIIINEFRFPFYANDSGFYLGVIRELSEGNKYFTEIASPYTPLAILIMGIPTFLFNVEGKLVVFLINILFLIGSSVLIYKVLLRFKSDKIFSLIFSFLFFLLALNFDGNYIIIEPITVFFQLFSFYFFIRYKENNKKILALFYAGLLLGFSFLSKQYGLFLLIPFYFYLLFTDSINKIKKIILLSFGVFLPTLLMYIIFYSELSPSFFLKYIIGNGIDVDVKVYSATGTSINYIPFKFTHSKIENLIKTNLYICLIPLYLIRGKIKNKKEFTFFLLTILSSLTVLVFASYDHYFHFIFPFLIIFIGYIRVIAVFKKKYYLIPVCVSILFLSVKSIKNSTYTLKENHFAQTNISLEMNKFIPEKSNVFLSNLSPAYYYLNKWKSIDLKRVGFLFPEYYHPKTVTSLMKKNHFLILTKQFRDKYSEFNKSYDTIQNLTIKKEEFLILKKNR